MTNQEQEKELIKKPPILDEVKAEIRANLWDVLFKTHQLTICVKPILEAQRDADYEYFLKAIPLISAQARKQERETVLGELAQLGLDSKDPDLKAYVTGLLMALVGKQALQQGEGEG